MLHAGGPAPRTGMCAPCFLGSEAVHHCYHVVVSSASSWSHNVLPYIIPCPCVTFRLVCSFTGLWTVTRSSLRMLRRVAAFCRPLRPVLLLVSFPRSRSPVVGVLGLC